MNLDRHVFVSRFPMEKNSKLSKPIIIFRVMIYAHLGATPLVDTWPVVL